MKWSGNRIHWLHHEVELEQTTTLIGCSVRLCSKTHLHGRSWSRVSLNSELLLVRSSSRKFHINFPFEASLKQPLKPTTYTLTVLIFRTRKNGSGAQFPNGFMELALWTAEYPKQPQFRHQCIFLTGRRCYKLNCKVYIHREDCTAVELKRSFSILISYSSELKTGFEHRGRNWILIYYLGEISASKGFKWRFS
jgi:hypothetical protein